MILCVGDIVGLKGTCFSFMGRIIRRNMDDTYMVRWSDGEYEERCCECGLELPFESLRLDIQESPSNI